MLFMFFMFFMVKLFDTDLTMFCCLVLDVPAPPGALADVARACSPTVETIGDQVAVFDAAGLERVIGPPGAIGQAVSRLAADRGLTVRVAVAKTAAAAALLAHARSGLTVGGDIQDVACGGLRDLFPRHDPRELDEVLDTFQGWGLRTCADVARLPRAGVAARLGALGVALHQAASGEDVRPLVPIRESRRFIERLELEWPIEGLEPLAFVLARLCEPLAADLERADRGAVEIATRLTLVSRDIHARVLHLPAPMRDARVLRTLIALDLESHPPAAGIDAIEIELGVVPGRITQGSLLTHALPTPEALTSLMARLGALVGEARVGAPALVASHDARAIGMARFAPTDALDGSSGVWPARSSPDAGAGAGLRRFGLPLAARVVTERGAPIRVVPAARGLAAGRVVDRAGPWRSSGRWWAFDHTRWDRDEWDVELAHGARLRLSRDRQAGRWEIAGAFD